MYAERPRFGMFGSVHGQRRKVVQRAIGFTFLLLATVRLGALSSLAGRGLLLRHGQGCCLF